MNAPGVATQSYSRYRVLPSRQIMTTVPRCLCVPTTPLDLIHRMLLKMLCRTSNARWRMAALVPNGTHGLSFSEAPTKVPGTAYRLITSRCSSGTSTILYAVDGGAVMGLGCAVSVAMFIPPELPPAHAPGATASVTAEVDPQRDVPHARRIEVRTDLARTHVRRARGRVAIVGEVRTADREVV